MPAMKLSDYVFSALADLGLRQVFVVTGGAAMHLNDSLGRESRLRILCNHHEQASAIAAEGYARIADEPAIVNVTAGPGGINAINGVFGAWTDSIPMLIVSGQSKRETLRSTYGLNQLRQLGDQEVDIVSMVQGITKYAVMITDPQSIRYHLEKAVHLCRSGRPGPCWLDIPVDVQGTMIEPDQLRAYDPREDEIACDSAALQRAVSEFIERLQRAERPVILAGTGVRLAHAIPLFQRVIDRLGIPVTTAWTHDLLTSDHPLFCGRQGTIGERAGNLTVQNSDLLLVIGSRLTIRQISYNWKSFAREAFKIQVDVDPVEFEKPFVKMDLTITADAADFLAELDRQLAGSEHESHRFREWVGWCKERRQKYPVVQPRQRESQGCVNAYHFMEELSRQSADDEVFVCGDATACIVTFQTAQLRKDQRIFSNSGCASMGYDIPAAIGAAMARPGQRVVCLAGDGSLQMNIQELQTIVHHQLPIKIFVLSNGGYLSIRQTQKNFFGRILGCGPEDGVSFPDMVRVAEAYGLPACRISAVTELDRIREVLEHPGPMVCDVVLDQAQGFEPRLSSRQLPDGRIVTAALEDMFPFLDPDELQSNLLISPQET